MEDRDKVLYENLCMFIDEEIVKERLKLHKDIERKYWGYALDFPLKEPMVVKIRNEE